MPFFVALFDCPYVDILSAQSYAKGWFRKAGSYKNLIQSNRAYFNRKVELYHEIITGNNELDVLMFM